MPSPNPKPTTTINSVDIIAYRVEIVVLEPFNLEVKLVTAMLQNEFFANLHIVCA
jgi:hypothetical protein